MKRFHVHVSGSAGMAWETFHTLGDVPVFGEHAASAEPAKAACCVPETLVSFVPRPKTNACCG